MIWLGLVVTVSSTLVGAPAQGDDLMRVEAAEKERRDCRAGMMTFANAAMAYRVQQRKFPSKIDQLDEFF
jgi:hypothetical protein